MPRRSSGKVTPVEGPANGLGVDRQPGFDTQRRAKGGLQSAQDRGGKFRGPMIGSADAKGDTLDLEDALKAAAKQRRNNRNQGGRARLDELVQDPHDSDAADSGVHTQSDSGSNPDSPASSHAYQEGTYDNLGANEKQHDNPQFVLPGELVFTQGVTTIDSNTDDFTDYVEGQRDNPGFDPNHTYAKPIKPAQSAEEEPTGFEEVDSAALYDMAGEGQPQRGPESDYDLATPGAPVGSNQAGDTYDLATNGQSVIRHVEVSATPVEFVQPAQPLEGVVYDMADATTPLQKATPPRGGIRFSFIGLDPWKNKKGQITLLGLNNYRVFSEEKNEYVANEAGTVVIDAKNAKELSLHSMTDNAWQPGQVTVEVSGEGATNLQTKTITIEPGVIADLLSRAKNPETLAEGEDGYLDAEVAPDNYETVDGEAGVYLEPVKQGGLIKYGNFTVQGGKVFCQVQLAAPVMQKAVGQYTAEDLKRHRERAKAEALQELKNNKDVEALDKQRAEQKLKSEQTALIAHTEKAMIPLITKVDDLLCGLQTSAEEAMQKDWKDNPVDYDRPLGLVRKQVTLEDCLVGPNGTGGLRQLVTALLDKGIDPQTIILPENIKQQKPLAAACLAAIPNFFAEQPSQTTKADEDEFGFGNEHDQRGYLAVDPEADTAWIQRPLEKHLNALVKAIHDDVRAQKREEEIKDAKEALNAAMKWLDNDLNPMMKGHRANPYVMGAGDATEMQALTSGTDYLTIGVNEEGVEESNIDQASTEEYVEVDADVDSTPKQQLTQLHLAIQRLQAAGQKDDDIVRLIPANQVRMLLLMGEDNFRTACFNKESTPDQLLKVYDAYKVEREAEFDKAAKARESKHSIAVRRSLKAIAAVLGIGVVGLIASLAAEAADEVCIYGFGDSCDDNAPSAAPSVGPLALAEHFATACGVNATAANLVMGTGTVAVGIVGQAVQLQLNDVVNTMLGQSAQFAYRLVANAGQQLGRAGEVLSNVIVWQSDNPENHLLGGNVTLGITNAGDDNVGLQRVSIHDVEDVAQTGCEVDDIPVRFHSLSDFVTLSANNANLVALSDNSAQLLGFRASLMALPNGVTLQYRVTGVNNAVLQRADNSFVFPNSEGDFPVSIDDLAGLKIQATQGFQGEITPTLVAEVIDQTTGEVINNAQARVQQTVTIEYVAPLTKPVINTDGSSLTVLEGQAASVNVDVFSDNGSSVTVELRNIAQGTTFSLNGNAYTATDPNPANNVVDISTWGEGAIAVRHVDAEQAGAFDFDIHAVATRLETNEVETRIQRITARFDAVADPVGINTHSNVTLTEGTDLVLPIQITSTGGPHDRLTNLVVGGQSEALPEGTILTVGGPVGSSNVTQSFTTTANTRDVDVVSWSDWVNEKLYVHFPSFYTGDNSHQSSVNIDATVKHDNAEVVSNSTTALTFVPQSNSVLVNVAQEDLSQLQGDGAVNLGLEIDQTTVDPNEVVTYEIIGNGLGLGDVQFNNATLPVVNGTVPVLNTQVSGLHFNPRLDSVGNAQLTLRVTSQFPGTTPAVTEYTVNVELQSAKPVIDFNNVQTNEDAPVAVPITLTRGDTLMASQIPMGVGLTDGANNFLAIGNQTSVDITRWDSQALQVTPAQHNGDDFAIHFTANNTNLNQSSTRILQVGVVPKANKPLLTVPNEIVNIEDVPGGMLLGIQVELVDKDGSETLDPVLISGVVNGTLSAGSQTQSGVWSVPADVVSQVRFLPDNNFATQPGQPIVFTVTATARETENSDTSSDIQVSRISVTGQADTPNLSVTKQSGDEDVTFNIGQGIQASLNAPGETLAIHVRNVPAGAVLSFGTKGNDGIWRISGNDIDRLSTLTYRDETNFSGARTLAIDAIATHDVDEALVTASMDLTINPVADQPVVSAPSGTITTNEDQSVALNLGVTLADTDGSEVPTVEVSNVANGSLDRGTNLGGGVWALTETQANAVRFVPGLHFDGTVNLSVKGIATETGNNDQASSPVKSFNVQVNAVADGGTIVAPTASGNEDSPGIDLNIAVTQDDPSEEVTVEIQNLPTSIGALNKGTRSGSTWTLTKAQLTGLQFIPASNWSGSRTLTIRMTTREQSNGDTKITSKTQQVNVAGVPNQPGMNSLPALNGCVAGTDCNLNSRLIATFADDPQEVQTYRITVPTGGYSISGTGVTNLGGRVYEISKANASTAKLVSPTSTSARSIDLNIQAHVTEDGQTATRSRTLRVNLAKTVVATTPCQKVRGCDRRRDVGEDAKSNFAAANQTLFAVPKEDAVLAQTPRPQQQAMKVG